MGGFGSGRDGWKRKAGHCHSLDINKLNRDGCLADGFFGSLEWSRDGRSIASIGLRSNGRSVTLHYRQTPNDGEPENIEMRVFLDRTSCHYGKTRPWFMCPGIVNGRHCGRRVGKLFLAGRYFLCRHCQNLAYNSQSETALDRMYRKRDKLRMSFGAEPGCFGHIPPRPKGMWHRTYQRRREKIFQTDMITDIAFEDAAAKLLSKLKRHT